MGLISVLWGILALLWMVIALIPLLGWGNWFMIPFATGGVIVGGIGIMLSAPGRRGLAKLGLVLNLTAIAVGTTRLLLGGGLI